MKSAPLALFLVVSVSSGAFSAPATYQEASNVLGQPDFVTETFSDTSAQSFNFSQDVAIDPTTGKLFVADTGANRVLRFPVSALGEINASAEAVFGQADFVSAAAADPPTAASMRGPFGITVDSAGRLWVADRDNRRVLRFDNASSRQSGTDADAVLGQADFTSRVSPGIGSHSGFEKPVALAIDEAGNLWVADWDLHRILRFDDAVSLNGIVTADGVLGQSGLSTFTPGTTISSLSSPGGLAVDAAGRLWVADVSNYRILRFDGAAAKGNGGNADGVLGQVDFVSKLADRTARNFFAPFSVEVGSDGTVWATDYDNQRVLGFLNGATKANGADADIILGQPDATTLTNNPVSARDLRAPLGLAVASENRLVVNEYEVPRILIFDDPAVAAAKAREAAKDALRAKIKKLQKLLAKARKAEQTAKVNRLKAKIKKQKKKLAAL